MAHKFRVGDLVSFKAIGQKLDPHLHQAMIEIPDDSVEPIADFPWFPDSYAKVEGGAWLSGFDSGMCAWIEVVPGTGSPAFDWPIQVTDDGEPFNVNASRGTSCDGQPQAHGIAGGPGGRLAFLASGAARSRGGFGRLSSPERGSPSRFLARARPFQDLQEWLAFRRAQTRARGTDLRLNGKATIALNPSPFGPVCEITGRRQTSQRSEGCESEACAWQS